ARMRRVVARNRSLRSSRPSRLGGRARRARAPHRRPTGCAHPRRRVRDRLLDAPSTRRGRRHRPEWRNARRRARAGTVRNIRAGRRARASLPGRVVRPHLHELLLLPPRGARTRALPRAGPQHRACARRRRHHPTRGRASLALGGAGVEGRLPLDCVQARLRTRRARAGARRQGDARGRLVRCRAGVTRGRSTYRAIASLQRDNRVCSACAEAGYPLESLPVVLPYTGQRAYMFGQAPGVQEGEERLPWRGRAGQTLRRWFHMDEDTFYSTFYCASVTRCYPGRAPSGRGDRTPTPREQELCALWRDWEFRLLGPQLIVTVGGLAARRLLGVKSVTECVGARYERDGS